MSLELKNKHETDSAIDEYFDTIYRRYYSKILNYIYNLIENENISADVTSEVFLAFYKSLNSPGNILNVEGWLYKTAKRKLIDYRKKKTNNEIPMALEDMKNKLIHWDKSFDIFSELEDYFDEADITDLKLHFMYGYTLKNIADYRHKSEASYKMKFSRIYEKIRKLKIFLFFLSFFVTICIAESYFIIGGLK